MEIPPGGWTVFQKRFDGSVSFNRTWAEYQNGFGSARSEYWLGNEILHTLTKRNNTRLHIIINSTEGHSWYEDYGSFAVDDKSTRYRLTLGGPANGTAGDMMMDNLGLPQANLSGKIFYTSDPPYNDNHNCTARLHGGWWFAACDLAFLNGLYGNVSWWNPWHGRIMQGDTFLASEMSFNRRHITL
ncbi:ficolin-1-like [Saccostrea cucullata]|uniref:ficolin-1-like n=1 Tax=Saccostrea cuccullata TaxID=36930 RepID=UPI002ECFC161